MIEFRRDGRSISEDMLIFIGMGANWTVHEVNFDGSASIIKITSGFHELRVRNNLENYALVKKAGLPTISWLTSCLYENKPALLGQNINATAMIYVSPNSLISDEQRLVAQLATSIIPGAIERRDSVAEEFRYRNKLNELRNFKEFLNAVKSDLIHISELGLQVDFDSYFFGTLRGESSSDITYMIADFDHISQSKESQCKILDNNFSEFERAIYGFVTHFVEEKKTQIHYIEFVHQMFNPIC